MFGLGKYKTEIIGISAEIAIADIFDIIIPDAYRRRGAQEVVEMLKPIAKAAFIQNNIPKPVKHIAEDQNPVDFILATGESLSVKTNQKKLGKVAPQEIGQPTSKTFFKHFHHIFNTEEPLSYFKSKELFKELTIDNIDILLKEYWDYLFNTDYYLHFFDVLNSENYLSYSANFIVFDKIDSPTWNIRDITFSQTKDSWNESNTVRYHGISIGEFQVHNNRNCFKFRFIMNNIVKLVNEGIL